MVMLLNTAINYNRAIKHCPYQDMKFNIVIPLTLMDEIECRLSELISFMLLKKESFYGNVLIQLNKKIDCTFSAPAGVNMQYNGFTLKLNPIKLVTLAEDISKNIKHMIAIYIHECLHILNEHLTRIIPYRSKYEHIYINIATDCAINQYIDDLPDGCVTLEGVSEACGEKLEPKREFDYYLEKILKIKIKKA